MVLTPEIAAGILTAVKEEYRMICGMTYFQICLYFLFYSFGGWVVEVIFHAVTLGKVINRGFLNGPVCPVYGFGVLSVFALLNTLQSGGHQMSEGMIFLFGIVLATAVELVAGWLLDVCFHARWWDYSNKPLNFHGYICLEFSLIWGLAIVMVVKVFMAILYAVYLADLIVTVAVIRGLNKKLTRLDKVRADLRIVSDKLSDTLATTTIDTAQKVGEGKVQVALAKAELRDATVAQREKSAEMLRMKKAELQAQFDELSSSITNHTVFGQGRIIKAFPEMKHRDYFELIQELKKKLR